MAAYDISRVTFDHRKHYDGVRMQQGRVLVDDDWNESERIENEERRRSRVDIIGPFGSPDRGFRIENLRDLPGIPIDFTIHPGTFHLAGLRLEIEPARPSPPVLETFRTQRDWLQQRHDLQLVPVLPLGTQRFDIVYLEAWQQAVCAVEDEELFEKALGGPDTTTRIRNMRRVLLGEDIGFSDCARAWRKLTENWSAAGQGQVSKDHELIPEVRLTVSYTGEQPSDDLCSPAIAGGYLGAENQAIRVQLTDNGHFTWGFDNAAPLYRVVATGPTVTFLTEPKDQHHWPLAGQTVEIIPWSAVLANGEKIAEQKGHLSKVDSSYDPDTWELTLQSPLPAGFGTEWTHRSDSGDLDNQEPAAYFYLRVWDRGADMGSDPEILITAGPQPLGQTGLAITISGPDRRADDHWVIAARPETPDQVMPWALEEGLAPHGCRRFYAPLALIRWTGTASGTAGQIIRDCRKTFRPLTDLEHCCTYSVGDGLHSQGDFNSLEEALQNLPEEGGKICVLPGEHVSNVSLTNRRQIHISGCGEKTIIRPRPDFFADPIFQIDSSQQIQLDHLTLVSVRGSGVVVRDTPVSALASQEITIGHNRFVALKNAIRIQVREDLAGDNHILIAYNQIAMIDLEEGEEAIFAIADGVLIERNRIVVVPPPDPGDPNDPRDPDNPPTGEFDPCADRKFFYTDHYPLGLLVERAFLYLHRALATRTALAYKTRGGIQIGGTSEQVRILENTIIGGRGNGITLGHLPPVNEEPVNDTAAYGYRKGAVMVNSMPSETLYQAVTNQFFNVLYELVIESNHISQMGLSGVGAVTFFQLEKIRLMVSIEDLVIYRNIIRHCANQLPQEIPDDMLQQAGFGGIALADCKNGIIAENRIEENGVNPSEPVCGIFMLHGEKMDISDNHILNNGLRTGRDTQIRPGERGGIVIKASFRQFQSLNTEAGREILFDSSLAIKVHHNVVVQPVGHALFLMAFGPVSVVGNQFTSQGVVRQNIFSLLAGSVFIFNLGISKDLLVRSFLPKFFNLANTQSGAGKTSGQLSSRQDAILRLLQYLPSGRVLFANNQTNLDLLSDESTLAISSQLIVTLDDVGYSSNQSECTGFLSLSQRSFDIVLTDVFLLAYSVRSNDNRYQEGFALALYSLISYGYMNTALGNQSTYCLHVLGTLRPPLSLLSITNMVLNPARCRNDYQALARSMNVPPEAINT